MIVVHPIYWTKFSSWPGKKHKTLPAFSLFVWRSACNRLLSCPTALAICCIIFQHWTVMHSRDLSHFFGLASPTLLLSCRAAPAIYLYAYMTFLNSFGVLGKCWPEIVRVLAHPTSIQTIPRLWGKVFSNILLWDSVSSCLFKNVMYLSQAKHNLNFIYKIKSQK